MKGYFLLLNQYFCWYWKNWKVTRMWSNLQWQLTEIYCILPVDYDPYIDRSYGTA